MDALGLALLHRHEDHPLLCRLQITPLPSQLPSTTTAHVTTMHFGVPVEYHGLYEWNILEPALGEVICPLRFTLASSDVPEELLGRLDPAVLAPGPTFYETLGAPAFVLQPRAIEHSTFTRLATRGASVQGFETLAEGLSKLGRALNHIDGSAYAFLYWDEIDRTGHEQGPGSPQFHAAARAALDAVEERLQELRDVTVLLCADHGQVDVSPERVDYLDDVWPELPARLSLSRPAGSSRDVFLQVREGQTDVPAGAVRSGASELPTGSRPGGRRRRCSPIGPRPARVERLGQVVVLPAPGRQAWMRSAAANERWVLGQHGGLDPAETATYLPGDRARVHFGPEEDRDLDGYYEMFVFDPDGFRIEIAYGPPAGRRRVAIADRHPGVPVEHTSWLHNALPPAAEGAPPAPREPPCRCQNGWPRRRDRTNDPFGRPCPLSPKTSRTSTRSASSMSPGSAVLR